MIMMLSSTNIANPFVTTRHQSPEWREHRQRRREGGGDDLDQRRSRKRSAAESIAIGTRIGAANRNVKASASETQVIALFW